MMQLLFTNHKTGILSKLIMKLTGEPASHCAIRVDRFVIHSNGKGIHSQSYTNFVKHNNIVKTLTKEDPEFNEKLFKTFVRYENRSYDYLALLFLGIVIMLKLLKLPYPKQNLWQSTGMFLCTEWLSRVVQGKENSMITPYKLYEKLSQSGEWKDG